MPDGSMKSISHMLTPIDTADEDIVNVYWEEELGYYWKNLSHDDSTIDMILDDVRRCIGYIDWDQSYNVVPSGCVGSYFNKQYPTGGDSKEIIAISYG